VASSQSAPIADHQYRNKHLGIKSSSWLEMERRAKVEAERAMRVSCKAGKGTGEICVYDFSLLSACMSECFTLSFSLVLSLSVSFFDFVIVNRSVYPS